MLPPPPRIDGWGEIGMGQRRWQKPAPHRQGFQNSKGLLTGPEGPGRPEEVCVRMKGGRL
jgi:hypothetical protein